MIRYSFDVIDRICPPFDPHNRAGGEQANRLGMRDRQAVTWWRENGLDAYTADRLATHLGYHPVQLWPSWMDDAATERCRWCGGPIAPNRTSCGDKCAHLLRVERTNVMGLREMQERRRLWRRRLDRYRTVAMVELREAA